MYNYFLFPFSEDVYDALQQFVVNMIRFVDVRSVLIPIFSVAFSKGIGQRMRERLNIFKALNFMRCEVGFCSDEYIESVSHFIIETCVHDLLEKKQEIEIMSRSLASVLTETLDVLIKTKRSPYIIISIGVAWLCTLCYNDVFLFLSFFFFLSSFSTFFNI